MKRFSFTFNTLKLLVTKLSSLDLSPSSSLLIYIHSKPSNLISNTKLNAAIIGLFNSATIIFTAREHENDKTSNNHSIEIIEFHSTRIETFIKPYCPNHLETIELTKDFYAPGDLLILYGNTDIDSLEHVSNRIRSHYNGITIYGGLLDNTYTGSIGVNSTFVDKGIIGILLKSPTLSYNLYTYTNLMTIGQNHRVTSTFENRINTLDHQPAFDFYQSYLGNDLAYLADQGDIFPLITYRHNSPIKNSILKVTNLGIITDSHLKVNDQVFLGYDNPDMSIERYKTIVTQLTTSSADGIFKSKDTLHSVHACESTTLECIFTDQVYRGLSTKCELVSDSNRIYLESTSFYSFTLSESGHNHLSYDLTPLETLTVRPEQRLLTSLLHRLDKELRNTNKDLLNVIDEKTKELEEHHFIDHLTKLPNQNKLILHIDSEEVAHLALIDITAFININNFYGNQVGSDVLVELARLILNFIADCDYSAYRISSDIFAVSSSLLEDALHFRQFMKILQYEIHNHCYQHTSHQIYINTTMALSSVKKDLYNNGLMILEYAKSKKIPYIDYNAKFRIEERIKNNILWTGKIRKAIDENRISPYYQPIYNNKLQRIDRYETLMRLIDDDGSVITPYNFLQIAKMANLYKSLTKIVISKSFDYFKDLPYSFSVNISSEDILDEHIRRFIFSKLSSFPDPSRVIFELVESEGIENYDDVIKFIDRIKSYGAKIAIDDFGTGFSNFHYLFKLNVDIIKIDGSIIEQINNENAAKSVAETIVDFAKKMGITTIAEFVSDEAIFHSTNALGIDFSQGYYVAKPQKDIITEEKV